MRKFVCFERSCAKQVWRVVADILRVFSVELKGFSVCPVPAMEVWSEWSEEVACASGTSCRPTRCF